MNPLDKHVLNQATSYLRDNLSICEEFIAELTSAHFLPTADLATIQQQKTNSAKVGELVAALTRAGPEAFETFLELLRREHIVKKFVAEHLEKLRSKGTMNQDDKATLDKVLPNLCHNLPINEDFLDELIRADLISEEMLQTIRGTRDNSAKVRKVVCAVQQAGQKAFGEFIKALSARKVRKDSLATYLKQQRASTYRDRGMRVPPTNTSPSTSHSPRGTGSSDRHEASDRPPTKELKATSQTSETQNLKDAADTNLLASLNYKDAADQYKAAAEEKEATVKLQELKIEEQKQEIQKLNETVIRLKTEMGELQKKARQQKKSAGTKLKSVQSQLIEALREKTEVERKLKQLNERKMTRKVGTKPPSQSQANPQSHSQAKPPTPFRGKPSKLPPI